MRARMRVRMACVRAVHAEASMQACTEQHSSTQQSLLKCQHCRTISVCRDFTAFENCPHAEIRCTHYDAWSKHALLNMFSSALAYLDCVF